MSAAETGAYEARPATARMRLATAGAAASSVALEALSLCEVCCEELPVGSRAGCSGCAHRYCARCVGTYWEGLIFSGAHSRLHCMFGGCRVAATDADVAAVVPRRVFRRMLYFRVRDQHAANPHARFCPTDGCWALVCINPPDGISNVVCCGECNSRLCFKCERQLPNQPSQEDQHECVTRRPAPRQRLLFSLWATTHTKSCPNCGIRIQRSRGCAHMTCARCAAYFCWRCRGFLHGDCPRRGRPCVCDRLLTCAAYSGLFAAAIIGAPVLITGAVIGGAPWLVYRLVKRSKMRGATDEFRDAYHPGSSGDADQPYAFTFLQEQGGLFGVDELRARARYAHRARIVLDSDSDSELSTTASSEYHNAAHSGLEETGEDAEITDDPSEDHVCAESVPRMTGIRTLESAAGNRD